MDCVLNRVFGSGVRTIAARKSPGSRQNQELAGILRKPVTKPPAFIYIIDPEKGAAVAAGARQQKRFDLNFTQCVVSKMRPRAVPIPITSGRRVISAGAGSAALLLGQVCQPKRCKSSVELLHAEEDRRNAQMRVLV